MTSILCAASPIELRAVALLEARAFVRRIGPGRRAIARSG